MNIYTIFDKKSNSCSSLVLYKNDLLAFRQLKSEIFKVCDNNKFFNENDFIILRLGSLDTETLKFSLLDNYVELDDSVADVVVKNFLTTKYSDLNNLRKE